MHEPLPVKRKQGAERQQAHTNLPKGVSMDLIRTSSFAAVMLSSVAIPAFASTVISAPANGAQVSSPFTLITSSDTCSSLPVIAVGYSFDSLADTQVFPGSQMNGPLNAPSGSHTIHVKAWNAAGAVCVTDVGVSVGGGADLFSSIVPSNAVSISSLQVLGSWYQAHDGATTGGSSGSMSIVNSPSLSGSARMFTSNFSYFGGQRYTVHIDDDMTATNFFYDTWVYIAGNTSGFSNLEFDLNQTIPNGETVVMGFQCDTWNNTWDFSVNAGSATAYNDTWGHSKAACNARTWAPNQWHHVQIWFSHNASGWVTYHAVWLDGAQQDLNVTAFSGFMLGWAPALDTNFQIDGSLPGTSSATVYLDNMIVYRW
jgi:hypothetical protein